MSMSRSQVTNSASSDAATDTVPLFCSKLTIHTGKVWKLSRLAIVYSPSTSATVSTVADSIAVRRFGITTRQSVVGQPAPSELRRLDQGLNVERPQARIQRAVGERHRQDDVLEAEQVRRADAGSRVPP